MYDPARISRSREIRSSSIGAECARFSPFPSFARSRVMLTEESSAFGYNHYRAAATAVVPRCGIFTNSLSFFPRRGDDKSALRLSPLQRPGETRPSSIVKRRLIINVSARAAIACAYFFSDERFSASATNRPNARAAAHRSSLCFVLYARCSPLPFSPPSPAAVRLPCSFSLSVRTLFHFPRSSPFSIVSGIDALTDRPLVHAEMSFCVPFYATYRRSVAYLHRYFFVSRALCCRSTV